MAKHTRTNETGMGGLVPLSKADGWHVRAGDPHVDGWDVLAADGTKVGDVDDLLVDLSAQKARYLIVKLDRSFASAKGERVAVPVGTAELDESDDKVLLPTITAQQLATLPVYESGRFTREFENDVRERMGASAQPAGGDYYDHALFDEGRFYRSRRGAVDEQRVPLAEEELAVGKRRVQAGQVDIHKRVETEHVQQQVPVMHEEVEVERRPISPDRAARAAPANLEDQEIHVPLTEEEVVVEKHPVVKDELVIRKRAVEGTQQVDADIEKERAEIERHGNVAGRIEDEGRRREGKERRPER